MMLECEGAFAASLLEACPADVRTVVVFCTSAVNSRNVTIIRVLETDSALSSFDSVCENCGGNRRADEDKNPPTKKAAMSQMGAR